MFKITVNYVKYTRMQFRFDICFSRKSCGRTISADGGRAEYHSNWHGDRNNII